MSEPARWDDLRVFLAVARHESLSAAGRALRLDPATVARRIARLETALGTVLFRRSRQGYGLTAAGERLRARAEQAEQAILDAVAAAGDAERGLAGTLRIGAPDGCANHVLPGVVSRLAAENPELEVQIVALARVVNLSRREADMAISVSAPVAGRLAVARIADYHLDLVASPGVLARHGPIRRREDLRGLPVVGYIPDMIFDPELDYLHEIGVDTPALASNSVAVQLALIRAGAGIGFVHRFALPHAPELVRLFPGELVLKRRFHLVRHADDRRSQRLTRLARRVSALIREEIRRLEGTATGIGREA